MHQPNQPEPMSFHPLSWFESTLAPSSLASADEKAGLKFIKPTHAWKTTTSTYLFYLYVLRKKTYPKLMSQITGGSIWSGNCLINQHKLAKILIHIFHVQEKALGTVKQQHLSNPKNGCAGFSCFFRFSENLVVLVGCLIPDVSDAPETEEKCPINAKIQKK